MLCQEKSVLCLSWGLVIAGFLYFFRQLGPHTTYGRYVETGKPRRMMPAKLGWLIQELPSFLVPVLLLLLTDHPTDLTCKLLLCAFILHYFHRTFIYSLLTRGRPSPLNIVVLAVVFCSLNGFLQAHYILHCAHCEAAWHTDIRLIAGLFLFLLGMAINIHSDHILRNLRKPGEITYEIPKGGMFEWVSGANFLGEIVEWCGYALASWSMPAFSFAFFTVCAIGPRAYNHHRYYLQKFDDYPKSRKAVIPFIF